MVRFADLAWWWSARDCGFSALTR